MTAATTPLLAILILFGCSSGSKTTSGSEESGEKYPEFIPEAISASYDREELKRNTVSPDVAVAEGLEGSVILRVSLSKEGRVTKTEVVRSDHKVFNNAAIEAVKNTSFTPAIQNGHPVPFTMHVKVTFTLE